MILEQIKNPDFFNNSEQNMIYFLQNNLNSFDQVTLNKMAKESFSSTSSVLRFCKKLGFDGFKDFKLQLIREASISGQDLNFNLPFSPDDSVEDIGLHLSEILANGIKKTRNLLDPVQLEMTAYNIKKSHRVFLFGKGDSRISLENFKNKMIKLNDLPCVFLLQYAEQGHQCGRAAVGGHGAEPAHLPEYFIIGDEYQNNFYTVGNITSNDLVIFCTYSAMHHDYNSYLPVLKDHNVPIITVTSNIHSKLAVNSDIVLQLPDDESFDEKVASFASQTNMDFIFDYIYSIIFQKNYMENYHSKHAKDVYTNSMIYNKL